MTAAVPILPQIIGISSAIRHIHETIAQVAKADSTVLITGESGTGKELVAKTIHIKSPRAKKRYVAVNCAAFPHELLEAELFGHERGAFTGAVARRTGRFEHADGGTIFLDEIGDMPLTLQSKLLRVLQERAIERLGGNDTIPVNVRVISATNKNLEDSIKQGKFREDLYYRLDVIPIEIPPVRERKEDIPELCRFLLDKHAEKFDRVDVRLRDDAMNAFINYAWPGNVREIENVVERLLVLNENNIVGLSDLPDKITGRNMPDLPDILGDDEGFNPFVGGIDLNSAIDEYERRLINHALELHKGIKAQAAKYLNINRTTLIEKMKRLGM
ncbi:MAG: sigma-54-dependent Fis family transcriptional regulator [Nitrospirae bacterium]|nr:MAG: sigma-54-dependent Fis family transcriptional regulator [Nitrospirota bacterium]